MVERKVIIDKIVGFANAKLSELSSTNPVVLIARPYIARVINNNIAKFDSLLKLAQDDNGMVDIEGIINETADNLLVAQVKKYPEVLGGVEIGNGTIRVKIPLIDKVIELDTNDLTAFKETLTSK
jgi:hypothetical protein|uniref:Uncharacterized protein n=1 Tax=CrAss-like virus sp. ctUXy6 TaxID=2825835 RepID=A0A8S5V7E7_9CAUD|nr:MAG TPA: hypothetical protein [CrAss-like virus sp. ctUXy6]